MSVLLRTIHVQNHQVVLILLHGLFLALVGAFSALFRSARARGGQPKLYEDHFAAAVIPKVPEASIVPVFQVGVAGSAKAPEASSKLKDGSPKVPVASVEAVFQVAVAGSAKAPEASIEPLFQGSLDAFKLAMSKDTVSKA